MTVTILTCRRVDVAALDHHNPAPSIASFHARRYADQQAGTSTYLVAWRQRMPVGHAEITWGGSADPDVRDAHDGCPEINGLEVFGADLRGQGIGTALIAAAEAEAHARGSRIIGLGVATNNSSALRLYRRLGYRGDHAYRDRYFCIDSLGGRHDFANDCIFLTKPVPRHISRLPASSLLVRLQARFSGARPTAPRHM